MLIMFLFFSVAAYAMEHNGAAHKPLTKANGSRSFETTYETVGIHTNNYKILCTRFLNLYPEKDVDTTLQIITQR